MQRSKLVTEGWLTWNKSPANKIKSTLCLTANCKTSSNVLNESSAEINIIIIIKINGITTKQIYFHCYMYSKLLNNYIKSELFRYK